jgi:hypothetical protein
MPALLIQRRYMGKSETFDDALASFAMTYADPIQRDYKQLAESHARNAFVP